MIESLRLQWSRIFTQKGKGPFQECRIPGIVLTKRGTIIICYEGRMAADDDWANISLMLCRSTDDGSTWQEQEICLPAEFGGAPDDTLNNPTLIVDGDRVHLIFHWHYERAFHCASKDDGVSWSCPQEITSAFHEANYEWNVCATGPGHGIRRKNGQLVAPIWLANGQQVDAYRRAHKPSIAGAIASSDGGDTWHMECLLTGAADANETCIAELSDGRVLFNSRNREPDRRRRLGWYADNGDHVIELQKAEDLADPGCFGSMIARPDGTLLFANCDTEAGRINLTIKQSTDGGLNWEKVITVDEIGGYPDLAADSRSVYILYERTVNGLIDEMVLKKYAIE